MTKKFCKMDFSMSPVFLKVICALIRNEYVHMMMNDVASNIKFAYVPVASHVT